LSDAGITNDLGNLISYLEKQKRPVGPPKTVVDKETTKKEVVQNTKKILEECTGKIHADNPFTKTIRESKGFDVYKFESLMRSKLIDGHKRGQSYERPYISVTELNTCVRRNYYVRMKYPVDVAKQYQFAYLYLINQVGNTVHDVIQTLYDHTEVEKTIISEAFKVKGRVDGIRDNFLLEYKTIDVNKFKNVYFDAHYIQCLIYAYILNHEYNYNIDTITIVYVTRDLKRVIPFDLELDDKRALSLLKRAPMILESIAKKSVPDVIGADAEQCKYCPYVSICAEDPTDTPQPFKKPVKDTQKKSVFLL